MPREHLIGHVHFHDTVNHILLHTGMEMYADDRKAIVWFRNPERPELDQRIVFPRTLQVWTIHTLICTWREVYGVQDLGKERIPDLERVFCTNCGGTGWIEDGDGNQFDCAVCETKGYVELPLRSKGV